MDPADVITIDQLTALAGLIMAGAGLLSVVLVFVGNRMTASPMAIKALTETVESLRAELEAERKDRKEQSERYEAELKDEIDKRRTMQKKFEMERVRYQKYIQLLLEVISKAGITSFPEWDVSEDEV